MIDRRKKPHFVFVGEMTLGNRTMFLNLKAAIERRDDIRTTWLPIDFWPSEFVTKLPLISRNWSMRAGLAARARIRTLEKMGERFDAAFFHCQIPALFLGEFRKRVPTVISLDATPIALDEYGEVYHHHVATRRNPIEKLKFHLTRQVYVDAKVVLPWSEWAKRSLTKDYRIADEKIRIIPAGVNIEKWKRPASEVKEQQSDGRSINILFVGGNFHRKGGDLLKHIAEESGFEKCRFHFVTRSSDVEDTKNVTIYRGIEPNSEALLHVYHAADIFVLPTRGDTFSLSIIEAMASETAVIATRVGGIPEIVREGKTGFIIDPDDGVALRHRLRTLVEDASLRERMGRQARIVAEEEFNLDKYAEKVLDYLREAAGGRQSEYRNPG